MDELIALFGGRTKKRRQTDTSSAKLWIDETAAAFLYVEPYNARQILRDLVTASVSFEDLAAKLNAQATASTACSLKNMAIRPRTITPRS